MTETNETHTIDPNLDSHRGQCGWPSFSFKCKSTNIWLAIGQTEATRGSRISTAEATTPEAGYVKGVSVSDMASTMAATPPPSRSSCRAGLAWCFYCIAWQKFFGMGSRTQTPLIS